MLLPDGRVFLIGSTGNTAYYTPSTNKWAAGPVLPGGLANDDAPSTLLPNGKLLLSVDTPLFQGPTHFLEFDPTTNTYTDISSEFPTGYLDGAAYTDRQLLLPNGQVLVTNGGNNLLIYTPDSGALAYNVPKITSITQNVNGSFSLVGTGISGNSDGSFYAMTSRWLPTTRS